MSIIEIFLIGIGLSMDAFAVSVSKGLFMRSVNYKHALIIAGFFGIFQAVMPVLGWALAAQFSGYIESFDHWIAFGLLAIIGGKMLWDAFSGSGDEMEEVEPDKAKLDYRELVLLAIATSIDALAIGITFASLNVGPFPAVVIIGITTFVISLIGVVVGNRFGARYERTATIVGGIILIAIGVKVLLEHLGVIAF